jgi:hypothetical protein
MTVSSGRVQEFIQGDDVTLLHQVMQDVAYNSEVAQAPVLVNSSQTVKFFYPMQSQFGIDLIGYTGVAVEAYPTSLFTVTIPGYIAPNSPTPQRGTSTFLVGMGQTVRAEVTSLGPLKESYYLYQEVDILVRGFPLPPVILNLT